jgi:osmotically-inducible protein OsmY
LNAVKVKVEKGFVALKGKVHWHFEKEATDAAVRRLSGVTGVFMLELEPHPNTVDVKAKIMGALKRDAALQAGSIRVTIYDDKVHLEGNVRGHHERLVAERAAWSVPGVTGVEDRLTSLRKNFAKGGVARTPPFC